jgi:hypothetical protein
MHGRVLDTLQPEQPVAERLEPPTVQCVAER